MTVEDLHYLSATEALRQFRSRELSPVELLDAVVQRAEEVEPSVNALCHQSLDRAYLQAREAEKRYAGQGEAPRALEGIPVAVKEEEAISGDPWTQGSLVYEREVAPRTSCFAERVLDAGAVVHARTTTPEFSAAPFTRSKLWGTTRNPWNPAFGVGGSSGGSAAALAAGTTTLATGSDMAGSIRIPASFNGVVGYKPPYGRVPVDPPFNLDTYMHNGPMARTVADTLLMQNVLSGPHPADVASLAPRLELSADAEAVDGMTIAISLDFGGWAVDQAVRDNTLKVAGKLRALGVRVEVVDLNLPREVVNRAAAIHYGSTIEFLEELAREHGDTLSPYLASFVERVRRHGVGGTAMEGRGLELALYDAMAEQFARFDAVICPTVSTVGYAADDNYVDTKVVVDGVSLEDPIDAAMTVPFNILSRLPVLAVPSGFAKNGVPTGIQIVGPPYRDDLVFRLGAALESGSIWSPHGPRPFGGVSLD